jgi:hypothetical protein
VLNSTPEDNSMEDLEGTDIRIQCLFFIEELVLWVQRTLPSLTTAGDVRVNAIIYR